MSDRDRLDKLLGMLGSSSDGEVANAGRFIAKMARDRKMSIVELMSSVYGKTVYAKPQSAPPHSASDQTSPPDPNADWASHVNQRRGRYEREEPKHRTAPQPNKDTLVILSELLEDAPTDSLTEWEWNFCDDILNRYNAARNLSAKQLETVRKIIKKVKDHSNAGAFWR